MRDRKAEFQDSARELSPFLKRRTSRPVFIIKFDDAEVLVHDTHDTFGKRDAVNKVTNVVICIIAF